MLALSSLLWLANAAAGDLSIEIRDAKGAPLGDALVYAEPTAGTAPAVRAGTRALVDQVDKEFVPRVSIVQAGTEIFFPNSDNIRHSIYSFSPAKTFTTKLYSGREAAPLLFDKTGLVVLGCNIHDQMVAWVLIVDTPWFGKSGADGIATLRALPAGEYRVTATAPATPLKPQTVTLRLDAAPSRQTISLPAGG
jgi:plastocyanin